MGYILLTSAQKTFARGQLSHTSLSRIPFQHDMQGAQQHHAPSMMYLGKMCLYGQGFPVDYDMALLWFEKAAEEVGDLATTIFPALVYTASQSCILRCVLHAMIPFQDNDSSRPFKNLRLGLGNLAGVFSSELHEQLFY